VRRILIRPSPVRALLFCPLARLSLVVSTALSRGCRALRWAGLLALATLFLSTLRPAAAQERYDASWYDGSKPFVKIPVTQDGVYRLSGAALRDAGVSIGQIDPSTLRLLERGDEVPLDVRAGGDGALENGDALVFVGRRNRGTDEAWAYNYEPERQSSPYRSLYTDTLTYWLTWGGEAGRRYQRAEGGDSAPVVRTARDTAHRERDRTYHFGPSDETGNPLFTLGEGYYEQDLGESDTQEYTLALSRAVATAEADVRLSARMVGGTGSCHRAALEANFGNGFETVGEAQWRDYELATIAANVPQERLPESGALDLRVRTYATGFDELSGCDTDAPNGISVDFVESIYTRRLTPSEEGQQHFTAATGGAARTYALTGYESSAQVSVLSPANGRRFAPTADGEGTAPFTDNAPSPEVNYWAVAEGHYRAPGGLTYRPAGSRPDWTASANDAEYVVLTTEARRPTAEDLAAYRASSDGYATAVVTVEEVFDQFDYGRATPIAIRRFIHHTRSTWNGPARFVTFWGDATYPIRTATQQPDARWNVPAFGFAPSDAWYAMQYEGLQDWSEVVALGRVPVRTAEQGATFLEKLKQYESARLQDWQKRYLALSGGTRPAEQRRLEAYNEEWAQEAASPPTGMDTLYFSKQSSDALDASFQDSLDAALEQGAGWLNYFGHSAAQTWEIVTEAPSEFENAERLPFVVSLGCQTGAFAGGRFSEKPAPSFGEQLVLGMDPDTPFGPGSRNGAISHFGTSYLGSIRASATLNDALIDKVFNDTTRVTGRAVRQAKDAVAENVSGPSTLRDHLLQYNLLGDAAARLALPDRPNFHLEPSQLATRPLTPTPSDSLRLSARVENQGLVPADSVSVRLSHQPPGGGTRTRRRRLAPFRLQETVTLRRFLTEDMVGPNTFRAVADPGGQTAEAREDDNAAQRETVVAASGLRLVVPRDLGTAAANGPTFRLNLSSPRPERVRLQLAADSAFTDVRAEDAFEATGPLAKWAPGAALEDGATYYWRARIVSSGSEARGWRTGSFTAQAGGGGNAWVQQGGQFTRNAQQDLARTAAGNWRFGTFEAQIQAYSERGSGATPYGFNVGAGAANYVYLSLGIGVLVVDGQSGQVKTTASYCTYETNRKDLCTDAVDGEAAVTRLDSLIDTSLGAGDYLFVRTRNLARRSSADFSERLRNVFRYLGEEGTSGGAQYSQAVDSLTYRDLWVMQARKGFPDQTVERVRPPGSGNDLSYQTRLAFSQAEGRTTTARIGPAQDWGALRWQAAFEEADDRLRFKVLSAADSTALRAVTASSSGAGPLDLSGISAVEHPYLLLRATFRDSTGRTPPQLERWRLGYTPTAEIALDQTDLALLPADSLREGQQATVRAPVVNLTTVPSAPVRVRFAVTDSSNTDRTLSTDTLAALGPEEEPVAETTFSTASLAGENVLAARARQRRPDGSLVPEALAFNNSLVENFFVGTDDTAPEVRVSVDGRALSVVEEGDRPTSREIPFVSQRPTFEITLDDDSEFLTLDDPELIDVRFGFDIGTALEEVPFSSERLEFVPPEEPGAPARAIFEPELQARDTTYALEVEVEDARGNEPEQVYRAKVQVRTEVAVKDLYPYPNPMSTHTTFMFRLKGSTPAAITECRMRIYTLSGQLVQEMDLLENPRLVNPDEGGGLRPGWNRVPWDGRDADGDRMATGVYLYKVHMEGDGDLDVNDGGPEKIAIIR